jgi:hypothetical protein
MKGCPRRDGDHRLQAVVRVERVRASMKGHPRKGRRLVTEMVNDAPYAPR